MKLFCSGWQATNRERELAVIQGGALKWRCFSFAMLQRLPGLPYYLKRLQGAYDACVENNVEIMMDSGVVSWRSYRNSLQRKGNTKALDKLVGEDEFIRLYVDYCKKERKKWDFYVTIDLERSAPAIFERHMRIQAMGIKPVPVFHGDSDVSWLKRYRDEGYKLIGLASWPSLRSNRKQFKHYFDSCFNLAAKYDIRLHGLAMTAPWIMLSYPWYSIDSSSWSRTAGYGSIQIFDDVKMRMSTLHVSERHSQGKGAEGKQNRLLIGMVREQVKAAGFDYDELSRSFVQRHIWNSHTMLKLTQTAEKQHASGWNTLF